MDAQMKIDGDKVKALREEKSWSQEHLAAAAGVSARTVQRVEADGVGSAETKLALASALGVSVRELTLSGATTPAAGDRPPRILWGAWVGWATGALCSIGAVTCSYAAGHMSTNEFGWQLGVICSLLGTTLGVMGAVNGWLRSRAAAG